MIDTAIIVAGGLGTRLRPLTLNIPKPLIPVNGKPLILHTINQLKKYSVKKIILSVGYKAEQIKDFFEDGSLFGVKISYSIEDEPLGTGGAVKKAAKGLNEPFFLVWGDNLMDINYLLMKEGFVRNNKLMIMALTPREDVENFGVAKLNGGIIEFFIEKPKREDAPSNLINAGAFVINPRILELLPEGKSSLEKDCFEIMAKQNEISAYKHEGQWFPTDTMEKYQLALENFNESLIFENKKVIIADVDDTICDSCQQISFEMADQIDLMISRGYSFAFISGTKSVDLVKMISSRVKGEHHILGTTGTNYTFVKSLDLKDENNLSNDRNKEIYNYNFNTEEKIEIICALERLIKEYNIESLTTKEDQLQDRESQITLSAIGRNAPLELKASFDPDCNKRFEWMKFLKNFLSEDKYDIRAGGTTSLDVTRKGLDKEWGIRKFAENKDIKLNEVLFFGDKLHQGGNDYPAKRIVDCIKVKCPEDTLKELKKICSVDKNITIVNNFSNEDNLLLVNKPWGKFEQFTHNEVSTVKILTVNPEKRLSLQSHNNREELWIALDDGVIAEVNGVKNCLNKGDKVFISKGSKHRLSSTNKEVRVLEVSYGDFDENDIIRYEDDFGRISD